MEKVYSIAFNQKHDTITVTAKIKSKEELKRFIAEFKNLTSSFVGVEDK